MRAQEFIFERQTVPFQGIDMSVEREEDEIMVRASAGGRPLGSVLFVDYDGELMPQDLEVDERYRGQGIAAAMYDYVKSQGYRIRRSGQQTDAGAGFWDKHKPGKNVWEQGVSEVSEIRTPAYLYHATYRPLLKSIKQHGLGGDNAQAKWEDSKPGVIYLATDPNVAESYAETSDVVPEEWLDQIVILKISTKGLENKIQIDKNVQDNEGDTLEYHGIIPLSNISMYKQGVSDGSVTKKPQPYNEPNWAKKLPKEKLNALAGPRYKKDTKEQGVQEGLDPYRLERLDPQTRRVLTRMADHKEPGSWLSASEAYAMSLGLQYKNRDPRGWEQDVQRYVDLYRQYSGQGVSEVKILSKVKGKGSEPGQLPRFGRPIAPGDETRYLGTKVADWQGREIWRDYLGGQVSYHLFDPDTRTVIVTTFGSRYKNNPRSYIIHGLYAAPGNPVRAAEFYRGLVRDLGLTLISDRKQSPGGNRVWQQLEQFPDVEVYGYDTATDQALNFGAGDVEMYTVPSAAVAGSKEMQRVARDLRLVATAR